MMNRHHKISLMALAIAALPAVATAQSGEHDGYVRLGHTWSHLADMGVVWTDGVEAPGSDYTTNTITPFVVTAGWFVTDHIAIEGSFSEIDGTHNYPGGVLAGVPDLGVDEFETTTVSVTWHPMRGNRISPYLGLGYAYQNTTDNIDGFGRDFRIEDSHGPLVQAGVDVALTDRFSAFVDLKKSYYRADGSGFLGEARLAADSKLDPTAVQVGLAWRFGPQRSVEPTPLFSGTSPWFMRAGASRLELDDALNLQVGGAPFAGASLATDPHWTPTIQIGRRVHDNLSVVATLGLPPSIDASGGGTAASFGKLAEVQYGPSALTLQYQPWTNGWFRPYVGAGLTYMIMFSTKDSLLTNVDMSDDIAPVLELGADFMVNESYGLYAEVKRGWLETRATGNVHPIAGPPAAGAPVVGEAEIGPWVFSVGAVFRF